MILRFSLFIEVVSSFLFEEVIELVVFLALLYFLNYSILTFCVILLRVWSSILNSFLSCI